MQIGFLEQLNARVTPKGCIMTKPLHTDLAVSAATLTHKHTKQTHTHTQSLLIHICQPGLLTNLHSVTYDRYSYPRVSG